MINRCVIITGSREGVSNNLVGNVLDVILLNAGGRHGLFLMHGNASGVDRAAADWCSKNGVNVLAVPALWSFFNRKAGPVRNHFMQN